MCILRENAVRMCMQCQVHDSADALEALLAKDAKNGWQELLRKERLMSLRAHSGSASPQSHRAQ